MRVHSLATAVAVAVFMGSAHAQSSSMLMPEGSKDLYVGIVVSDIVAEEGGARRRIVALPTASCLWSNGLFAQLNAVGWDVSDDPTMDFGPIVTYGIRHKRADDTRHRSSIAIQGGAFYSFMFTRDIHFGSRLLYGGGADGGGVQLRLGADVVYHLGSHDDLTLSPGLGWADGDFMRSTYGVSAQQAQLDGLPTYEAKAGLRGVGVDLDWGSELSTKFKLDAGVSLNRLMGGAAHSPLIARRDDASIYTALSYHF